MFCFIFRFVFFYGYSISDHWDYQDERFQSPSRHAPDWSLSRCRTRHFHGDAVYGKWECTGVFEEGEKWSKIDWKLQQRRGQIIILTKGYRSSLHLSKAICKAIFGAQWMNIYSLYYIYTGPFCQEASIANMSSDCLRNGISLSAKIYSSRLGSTKLHVRFQAHYVIKFVTIILSKLFW